MAKISKPADSLDILPKALICWATIPERRITARQASTATFNHAVVDDFDVLRG